VCVTNRNPMKSGRGRFECICSCRRDAVIRADRVPDHKGACRDVTRKASPKSVFENELHVQEQCKSRCCVVQPHVAGVEVIAELVQLSCGGARPKLAGWARCKSITKRASQKTSTMYRGKRSAEGSARQILGLKQSWYDCVNCAGPVQGGECGTS
jgi:hypothetical protein